MPEDARIPKLTPRAQTAVVTSLPLDHLEGYILSRVDGTSTEEDLAAGIGMPHDRVVFALEKLAMLGLVTFQAYTGASGTKSSRSARRASSRKMAAVTPAVTPAAPTPEEKKAARADQQKTLRSIRREEEDDTTETRTARADHVGVSAVSDGKPGDKPADRRSQPPPTRAGATTVRSAAGAGSPFGAGPSGPGPAKTEQMTGSDETLSAEEKQRIDSFLERCKREDHYRVLGVDRTTDKKGVKKAYYGLAATYHPDRHFNSGRSVYRARMEEIFRRLTEAHDTLIDRDKRQRYDGSSIPQDRPSIVVPMPSDRPSQIAARPSTPAVTAVTGKSQPAQPPGKSQPASKPVMIPPGTAGAVTARMASTPSVFPASSGNTSVRAQTLVKGPASSERGPTTPALPPLPGPPRTPAVFPSEASTSVRVQALFGNEAPTRRAKLGDTRPSQLPPSMDARAAMDKLKQRYEATTSQNAGPTSSGDGQVKKYLDMAAAALAEKDPVSAMNTFRIALSLAPNNEVAKKGLEEAERQHDVAAYSANVLKAQTATERGDTEAAIKFYLKCTRGQPDEVSNYVFATHAILSLKNGDMREAARLAKRAVELRQADVTMRVMLVKVYVAAEMWQSAKTELDRSLEKWPKQDELKALLKTVKARL